MRYLYYSLMLSVCMGCASDYKGLKKSSVGTECRRNWQPRVKSGWYSARVDVIGKHMSGFLLIKEMPDSAYRVVFINEPGVTFLDFGFDRSGAFTKHHAISQLDKKPVIETLRKDFELILGLPFRGRSPDTLQMNGEVYFGVPQKKEFAYFITGSDCASLRRLEMGSGRKRKVSATISAPEVMPESIQIRHHTFDMTIGLIKMISE